ncbi:hypothetical protein [Pelotomaculum sp. FP]|uniref:hypothetical protein n=1 Tax=Pelotomaculum sp. FP TaxID=261474 RepID=UPI00129281DB|nr:hypothetical protein [Pelotomaculum sp. FP]
MEEDRSKEFTSFLFRMEEVKLVSFSLSLSIPTGKGCLLRFSDDAWLKGTKKPDWKTSNRAERLRPFIM